jgi:hypothetical protein
MIYFYYYLGHNSGRRASREVIDSLCEPIAADRIYDHLITWAIS